MNVKQGQIWRDNYGMNRPGFNPENARHVRVIQVFRESCFIQRCESNGDATPRSPTRETMLSRFNGGSSGFTLVRYAPVEPPERATASPYDCSGAALREFPGD